MQLQGARDANEFLEAQVKHYLHETKRLKTELPLSREEAVKNYSANFHHMEEYQSFASYWKRFGYTEVVEKA